MCVICVKPYNTKDFTEKIFKNCWSRNDDGAGFAYFDGKEGLWVVHKGLMKLEDLVKEYFKMNFGEDDYTIVHFRMGTSGLMDGGNTHPFDICGNLSHMRKTKFKSDKIAFHNGTCPGGDKKYSDTMFHVRDYLYPLMPVWDNAAVKGDIATAVLSKLANDSRWVVCVGNKVYRYGKWIDDEGKHYSNDYFRYEYTKSVVYTSSSYSSSSYNHNALAPAQPWHHGVMNGQHGFWKDGKFTTWKDYYKKKKSVGEEVNLTLTEAEVIVDAVNEIKDQERFDRRYILNVGSCRGKFVKVMDWKMFSRDLAARVKVGKAKELAKKDVSKGADTIWREPDETEKWAMGLNPYSSNNPSVETKQAEVDATGACPACGELQHIEESPFTVGDSICTICGCVFDLSTGNIHTYDQDIHQKFVVKNAV